MALVTVYWAVDETLGIKWVLGRTTKGGFLLAPIGGKVLDRTS